MVATHCWHTLAEEQYAQLVGLQLTHVPLTRELPDGHTQLLFAFIINPAAQPQVFVLALRVRLPTHVWQIPAAEQDRQFGREQLTQLPLTNEVKAGHKQVLFITENVAGHEQVLLDKVKFPTQAEQTPAAEQVKQFEIEQETQVPVANDVPDGHTQLPFVLTTNEVSGQEQVLALRVIFPVQFWQTFAAEQNAQLVSLSWANT